MSNKAQHRLRQTHNDKRESGRLLPHEVDQEDRLRYDLDDVRDFRR